MDISYYKSFEPIDGKWYITRELGSGAYGTVFEVERRDFGENMKSAMKIVSIPQSQNDVSSYREDNFDLDEKSITDYFYGFVEDFVKEYQIMHKLRGHSNIVSYEDHTVQKREGDIGWDIFIRMELLTPMSKYFASHNIVLSDIIKLGIDICKALEVCQKNNIIHRDIKPSNIFVSDAGDFKLGDFGVARTLEKTSSGLSKKGTYTYMAPEVFKGEEYGSTVDIYSLGIVMYRLLNNNMEPFRVDRSHSGEEVALLKRMQGNVLPKPVNADGKLAEIILKACSFNPQERFKTATEMRIELEKELIDIQNNVSKSFDEIYKEQNTYPGVTGENGSSINDDLSNDFENKTVGLFGRDSDLSFNEESFESDKKETEAPVVIPVNNTEPEIKDSKPKVVLSKKLLVIGGIVVATILALIVTGVVCVNILRRKLVELVPASVEMEENMTVDFLSEVYNADFIDGNINLKVSIDTSNLDDICDIEAGEDYIKLTGKNPGTAQLGVSVNGSEYRQVSITVYETIDKDVLLQDYIDAESFLNNVSSDDGIDQANVEYEIQALENALSVYDYSKIIDDGTSEDVVECKTHYETQVYPAIQSLMKSYAIAQEIGLTEENEVVNIVESTQPKNTSVSGNYNKKVKPKCSVCGSTEHTSHPVAKCPVCGSTEHTSHPEIKDDLYIEPF